MNINLGPTLPIGCGVHADRLEHLYRATDPLLAYLKPWGGEFVLVIRDGTVLGIVRRDRRPIWQKLKERIQQFFWQRFPKRHPAEKVGADDQIPPPSLADACA